MNIVFVASECFPFFKTGGLADVIGSLPQKLASPNDQISVILPKAQSLPTEYIKQLTFQKTFHVHVTWRKQETKLYLLQKDQITYYFIENDYYFGRDKLYGYEDDGERFAFFTHAVLQLIEDFPHAIDILHCHDWQTGLIPAYMKIHVGEQVKKTIFTIHNLQYQGQFPLSIFDELLHLSSEHLPGLTHNNQINFMKAAIFHADQITTVSPTYAKEITTELGGQGLDSVLCHYQHKLSGIINGINVEEYNPQADQALTYPYKQNAILKSKNKMQIQTELHLPISSDVPLFSVISRLVQSKGLDLLLTVADSFLQHQVQLIIVGSGESSLEEHFLSLQSKHPSKVRTIIGFSEPLARQVYASADFLLMPSLFEPCGISQMIALHYETVPIVRETGGLKDTILSFNEYTKEGNGLSFTNYNASDFLFTLNRAISLFRNKKLWHLLLQNVYQSNFNWGKSAKQYQQLYNHLLGVKGVPMHEPKPSRIHQSI